MSFKCFVSIRRVIRFQILITGAANPLSWKPICDPVFVILELKGIGSPVISFGFLITRPLLRCVRCLPCRWKLSKQVEFSKIKYSDVV